MNDILKILFEKFRIRDLLYDFNINNIINISM